MFRKTKFDLHRGKLDKLCETLECRGTMVEIGSLAGVSTEIFSRYFERVYSIDPYIPGYDSNDLNSHAYRLEAAKKIFEERFKGSNAVRQYTITSLEASERFKDRMFDLIYIDACHTYEGAKQDIDLWRNKGRYIGGHDWNMPVVAAAVLDSFEAKSIKVFNPNHWLVRRDH